MKKLILVLMAVGMIATAYAQNFTSLADGNWTTASKWSNTSGWGSSTPGINNDHNSGTITMKHNMFISTNYTLASATLNIQASKSLAVTGNMQLNGGSAVNVYGTLEIFGNLTLNSNLKVYPGGKVIVHGSVTVKSSNYLTIGTNASGPPYADMVIEHDLSAVTSGDVTIEKNGRLGVFGNILDNGGGGTLLTIKNGGQTYVNGNIDYSGGGSKIINNNSANPYGLYVNGTVSNSGGGSATTTNSGNQTTLKNTNPTFWTWLQANSFGILPVTLLSFSCDQDVIQGGIRVMWRTSGENNFDYFELEHAAEDGVFSTLAKIDGAGYSTSDVQQYSFNHKTPSAGLNLYRLKAVDLDGSYEYFNVISFNYTSAKTFSVYPNPVDGREISGTINFDPQSGDQIRILDMRGQVVYKNDVSSGTTHISLDLKPGIYLIQYESIEFKKSERLLVR